MRENRIYISGAISGTDDYMERFQNAEDYLTKLGFKSIVNPAKVGAALPPDTTHKEYMDISLKLLEMCGTIYMMTGWEASKGACIEFGFAYGRDYTFIMGESIDLETVKVPEFVKETEIIDEPKTEQEEPVEEKKPKKEVKKVPVEKKTIKIDYGKVCALRKAGWTYKQISEEMGCSPHSAECIVSKMKKDGRY